MSTEEPKESAVMSDSDVVDAAIDKFSAGEETPSESSTEKETVPEESEVTEEAGADQPEKAESEEAEEEKGEEADPKDLMFRKGYNEAKAKSDAKLKALEEKLSKFSDFESKLEQFQKVTSSPEYVKAQMKAEGYRDEVINAKLKEMGVSGVPEQDDVQLVLRELGVREDQIDTNLKSTISDIARIADIIARDRFNKTVPERLKPVEQRLTEMNQTTQAGKILESMQRTVEGEGVLDFKADILPILDKYTRENPNATQLDVFNYFKDMNHKLTLERFRLGKNKETRNQSKSANRPTKESVPAQAGPIAKFDGKKAFSSHLDDVLDKAGIKW